MDRSFDTNAFYANPPPQHVFGGTVGERMAMQQRLFGKVDPPPSSAEAVHRVWSRHELEQQRERRRKSNVNDLFTSQKTQFPVGQSGRYYCAHHDGVFYATITGAHPNRVRHRCPGTHAGSLIYRVHNGSFINL